MDDNATKAYSSLERMLFEESEEPKKLPLSLLESITSNFSADQEIGRGGFAAVYKGMLGIGTIAVKKLSGAFDIDEKQFNKEVQCLMKVRHKNIVRFLGYCADTQGEVADYGGKSIIADVRNRVLCFEYVPNGSLDNYITDASCGLQWKVRYQMIKGIAEGLHYLHGNNIAHLDLKPANILVDDNMVPKIADFGLSRCFDENQSKIIATTLIGTLGYLAPEFHSGKITFKLDIFSLGVIIMEILTGKKEFSTAEKVKESWRNRLDVSQQDLKQIMACSNVGIKCMETNPASRPTAQDIIETFKELEGNGCKEAGVSSTLSEAQTHGPSYSNKFLKINPLHLRFPSESDQLMISCPLHLTNITDDHVAFRLRTKIPIKNFVGDLCGIVPPRSTYTLAVTMCSELKLPSEGKEFLTLESSIEVYRDMQKELKTKRDEESLKLFLISMRNQGDYSGLGGLFTSAKKKGRDVHAVKLTATYMPAGTKPKITMAPLKYYHTKCQDVHPTEPWILMGDYNGFIHIKNYLTQEVVNSFQQTENGSTVLAVKFIARKNWFLAGDKDLIRVYDIHSRKLVAQRDVPRRQYEGSMLLTIHPTEPYVLSVYNDFLQVWDWDKDWECIWKYHNYFGGGLCDTKFNPEETLHFAGASGTKSIKIWDAGSDDVRNWTLAPLQPLCLEYIARGDVLHLITGCTNKTAKIWDYERRRCVHTLEGHTGEVNSVCSHADLPIIVTGSDDGTVRLWNSTTYKIQSVIDCGLGSVKYIYCLKATRRIAIVHSRGLAIADIDH